VLASLIHEVWCKKQGEPSLFLSVNCTSYVAEFSTPSVSIMSVNSVDSFYADFYIMSSVYPSIWD